MQRTIDIIQSIIRYICYAGIAVLFLMMLLTVADVIGRSIFNSPVPGTYEISKFLLVVVVLLSVGYVEQSNQNIHVDFFTNKMPFKVRLLTYIILTLVSIAFLGLVMWKGWEESFVTIRAKTASDIWRIPAYPFQFAIPFGLLLLVIELVLKIIVSIRTLKEGPKAKETTS